MDVVIIGCCSVILTLFLLWRAAEWQVKKHEASISWYKNWFRIRQGCLYKYGSYYIISLDCGRTWYEAETTDDKYVEVIPGRLHAGRFGFKILRPAPEELLAELDLWDELSKLVEETS